MMELYSNNDDFKRYVDRYCMEHDGEFIAVHEVVSRVKR